MRSSRGSGSLHHTDITRCCIQASRGSGAQQRPTWVECSWLLGNLHQHVAFDPPSYVSSTRKCSDDTSAPSISDLGTNEHGFISKKTSFSVVQGL
ncbi:hypothetical protein STEG23_018254, partial [Scotinomys teguina]